MTTAAYEVYDRRVDQDFLDLFLKRGPLHSLARLGKDAALPLDLQFRKDPKRPSQQRATLYAGLTAVLHVHRTQGGVKLDAHDTWSGKKSRVTRNGFKRSWLSEMTAAELEEERPEIELYLERAIPLAVKSHGLTEGAVQSVVSKATSSDWAVLDREVLPAYPDSRTKSHAMTECMAPLMEAVGAASRLGTKLPRGPKSFGPECDLLAIDKRGRVLAIEVKPMGAGTIAWVAAQAAMYGRIIRRWIESDPHATEVLTGMLEQRQALGHARKFSVDLPDRPPVVPVVVLQRGASAAMKDQMARVRAEVDHRSGLAPVETYEVSILGEFKRLS